MDVLYMWAQWMWCRVGLRRAGGGAHSGSRIYLLVLSVSSHRHRSLQLEGGGWSRVPGLACLHAQSATRALCLQGLCPGPRAPL